jgi:hypothetical protein
MQEIWVAYRGAKFPVGERWRGLERLLRGCLSRWEEDKPRLSSFLYVTWGGTCSPAPPSALFTLRRDLFGAHQLIHEPKATAPPATDSALFLNLTACGQRE